MIEDRLKNITTYADFYEKHPELIYLYVIREFKKVRLVFGLARETAGMMDSYLIDGLKEGKTVNPYTIVNWTRLHNIPCGVACDKKNLFTRILCRRINNSTRNYSLQDYVIMDERVVNAFYRLSKTLNSPVIPVRGGDLEEIEALKKQYNF